MRHTPHTEQLNSNNNGKNGPPISLYLRQELWLPSSPMSPLYSCILEERSVPSKYPKMELSWYINFYGVYSNFQQNTVIQCTLHTILTTRKKGTSRGWSAKIRQDLYMLYPGLGREIGSHIKGNRQTENKRTDRPRYLPSSCLLSDMCRGNP